MKRFLTVALMATASYGVYEVSTPTESVAQQDAHAAIIAPLQSPKPECYRGLVSAKDYVAYAKPVFARDEITVKAQLLLRYMEKCQRTEDATKFVSRYREKLKYERRLMLQVATVTPYVGPNGTHWAIPWSIISCESGGSWNAANPSGAIGPYQLLGWGAPWPVNSEEDKMEHHRIAARVWNGGAGRGNWVC